MENHHLFLTSQQLFLNSISHDHVNFNPLLTPISHDHVNFDGFDLITANYDHLDELLFFDGGLIDNGLYSTTREEVFDAKCYKDTSNLGMHMDAVAATSDLNLYLDGIESLSGGVEEDCEENSNRGDGEGDGNSSTTTKRPRRDRLKTLVSERRRRGRMKEKLYELRSLVPNITKMDKSSIIGDAVIYVQNLLKQAKKLMEEIEMLESSSKGDQAFQVSFENNNPPSLATQVEENNNLVGGKITKMTVFEVGERRFYVRLVCNTGDGVAVALYTAIESLSCFHLESSNFSLVAERFVLTLTLNVGECEDPMNAFTMKLWLMGALLKEGFEFETMATS